VTKLLPQFTAEKPLTIRFPWVNPYTNTALRQRLSMLWGDPVVSRGFETLKGSLGSVLGESWLVAQDARTRVTYDLWWNPNLPTLTNMKLKTMDAWFPKINQGVSVDGVTRKMLDLSSEPVGEHLEALALRNCAFYPGRSGVNCVLTRPKLTFLGNLFFNLGFIYVSQTLQNVNRWHHNKSFFDRVDTKGLPIAAFLGCTGVVVDGDPCVTLHTSPRNAYNEVKRRAEFRDQLRWTGIHAPPSAEAVKSGTAANLNLVGKKTNTSRYRRNKNYLLYDRETATELRDAIGLHPAIMETHEMLDGYLDWYHERREEAARYFRSRKEEFKPGRWGFEPFAFAGVPETARLYMTWEA